MIAFDTNHLVRHIVQDDPVQGRVVAKLLAQEAAEERPVRILDLVLMETCWVLESVYGFNRQALAHVLASLLDDAAFNFDDPDRVRRALQHFVAGQADFADYLIHARAASEDLELKTFDKKLAKELR